MKSQQVLKSSNNKKVVIESLHCKDCGSSYDAKYYTFSNGWKWQTNRSGLCSNCQEKRIKEIDQQEKAKIQDEKVGMREKWRRNCGIPLKYQYKGFQHFEQGWQPKAYLQIHDYACNFPIINPKGYKSLVLFSTQSWGTGKTHLACSVAHHILSRWDGETSSCPVRFVSEPMLFKSIRDTYDFTPLQKQTQDNEIQIINKLINVPLLIIDDLGKEDVADLRFVQRTLFAIFDGRYNAELPVLITANLDDAGLRAHMGGSSGNEAAFNRLIEMCKGEFIRMDGKSYREKLSREG